MEFGLVNFTFSFLTQTSLNLATDINISGGNRIFLIDATSILNVVINSTNNIVTDIPAVKSWSVFNNLRDLNFTTKPKNTRNGTIYDTEINLTIPGITTIKNRIIFGLRNAEYVAIIQDNNDRFWLLGSDRGFTVDDGEYGTNPNGYSLKFTTRELTPLYEVAPTFMQSLSMNPYADSTEAVQAADLAYLAVSTATTAGQLGGESVAYPINGYTVGSTVSFVLATSGYMVKLPVAPQNNRLITVKDGGNGATQPVIISGNGKTIEGDAEAEINTDGGTMTLIYMNGEWKIYSFWNI